MFSPINLTVENYLPRGNVENRIKRVKNVQKLELVRLMKANFLFVQGKHSIVRSENTREEVWRTITTRLNSLGPPIHPPEIWQKRWNDMRSTTKHKMLKIKNFVSQYGEECPFKLTTIERLVWSTFCVKPERHIPELDVKLQRNNQRLEFITIDQKQRSNEIQHLTKTSSMAEGSKEFKKERRISKEDFHSVKYFHQSTPKNLTHKLCAVSSENSATYAHNIETANNITPCFKDGESSSNSTTKISDHDIDCKALQDLEKLLTHVQNQQEEIFNLM